MSKANNLTDFLTDVADAIRTKKGTSNLINPQDFSSEILSIPTGGGGDGTLPITIPPITAISYSTPNLTITPGDYSELESYNPSISYLVVFNNDSMVEFTELTNDISQYLIVGSNDIDITVKSVIQVATYQQNVAYSEEYNGVVEYSYNYLDLLNDFDHGGYISSATVTYSNNNKTMTFNKRPASGDIYMDLKYKSSVSDYKKVIFTVTQCIGAEQPVIELQISEDDSSYTTFETVTTPHIVEQTYEYSIPSGASYFNFKIKFGTNSYDPSMTIKNITFK